jgi:hypothetical protein
LQPSAGLLIHAQFGPAALLQLLLALLLVLLLLPQHVKDLPASCNGAIPGRSPDTQQLLHAFPLLLLLLLLAGYCVVLLVCCY